jgi:hypothetical protein
LESVPCLLGIPFIPGGGRQHVQSLGRQTDEGIHVGPCDSFNIGCNPCAEVSTSSPRKSGGGVPELWDLVGR